MSENELPPSDLASNDQLTLNVETAVANRYSAASKQSQPALCCPIDYDAKYLEVLPRELIERDYGCGNPAKYVNKDETVLDLGSGGGKICYIASQVVGPDGRVLGVDMNGEMLALARQFQPEIAKRIGWDNVTFYKGKIQDLSLDFADFEKHLKSKPVDSAEGWLEAQRSAEQMRQTNPMIASQSVDVVVSNCVLNLVKPNDRIKMFAEIFRVLKPGGRAVISDIVSDKMVPTELQNDEKLWSGCISGAFQESEFLNAFGNAGFYGMEIAERQIEPWQVVDGIEFRSVTVRAFKPTVSNSETESSKSVIYSGPWASVRDDDGNVFGRGRLTHVNVEVANRLSRAPYTDHFCQLKESSGACCKDGGCC